MLTEQEILARIKSVLTTTFEMDESRLKPETHLFQDLDLDSIDAIDLAVEMEKEVGFKLKEEDLRQIRTIQDILNTVQRVLQNKS